jgi:hypothetical protein
MKTAISIPDEVFEEAERLAARQRAAARRTSGLLRALRIRER